jgi:endoglucanase
MLKKHLLAFLLFVTVIIGTSCQKKSSVTNLSFIGTNAAGGDVVWGQANTVSPTVNQDYLFVSNQDIDYLASKKVGFLRLLISWETLQPTLNSPLATNSYSNDLASRVAYATSKGITVLLEPHGGADTNFARYKGNLVGTAAVPNAAFADFWTRMATQFKSNPYVMYGLSNEPHDMSTVQWFSAAQAAITGIRSTGSTQTIFVPGNGWTGASTWTSASVDTASPQVANSTAFLKLQDPSNNLVASVHMYLDANGGGGGDDIVSSTVGVERMTAVVNWAKANNVRIHLSEIGANLKSSNTASATGKAALQNLFSYINANSSTVIGWSWWVYGPPWGGYRFALSPASTSSYGTDSAQMSFLASYFAATPTPIVDAGVDASPIADASVDASPSASFPTNPIPFTKNAIFTTNSGQTNWVYVPNGYDSTHNTPTQLFVWLHGCGGQSQYDISMVSYFTNQGWISLAPGGRETTCWSGLSTDGSKILGAIADLKTHFNIDPKRVVLGGYSSGGDIGYPLVFQNAAMFAGALFENTGPSSAALTASTTAAWKLNIVHLAHLSDTTYPIATVRSNMTTLKNNGFPVTLIEKAGTHYDNDNGTTGTQYDLRTFLLPHLNDGWISGAPATPPPVCTYTYSAWGTCSSAGVQTRTVVSSTPNPCTVGPQVLSQACTPPALPACVYTYSGWGPCQPSNVQSRTVISTTPSPCAPGPQLLSQTCTYVPPTTTDTDGDGIIDSDDKCPTVKGIKTTDGTSNGCPGLVVSAVKTYDWGSGYCKQFYFTNNNPVPMSWTSMTIHLNDGKLRGATSVWGGTFPNPNATGTTIVTPSQNTKVNPGQKSQTVGFCADYGSTKYVGTNGGLTY